MHGSHGKPGGAVAPTISSSERPAAAAVEGRPRFVFFLRGKGQPGTGGLTACAAEGITKALRKHPATAIQDRFAAVAEHGRAASAEPKSDAQG